MAHWDINECGGDGECDSWADEPDCVDGLRHAWTGEGMGGCDSNPGVWSLGGTTIRESVRCRYCGTVRTDTYHGSQRNPYECDTRSYAEGEAKVDQDDLADGRRRARRNKRARERRIERKVDAYLAARGWVRDSRGPIEVNVPVRGNRTRYVRAAVDANSEVVTAVEVACHAFASLALGGTK